MTNDVLNNLFENPNPVIKRGPGRPRKPRNQLEDQKK